MEVNTEKQQIRCCAINDNNLKEGEIIIDGKICCIFKDKITAGQKIKICNLKITRAWAMPNSKTFKIKPIKELISKYINETNIVIDPFANEHSIEQELKCKKYISNDLDKNFKTDYSMEAQDFMKLFKDNSVDVVLFDPPYSGRQVSECYKKLNKTVTMSDTNAGYFTKFKKEISRILKKGGICISCGWNTNRYRKKIWICNNRSARCSTWQHA